MFSIFKKIFFQNPKKTLGSGFFCYVGSGYPKQTSFFCAICRRVAYPEELEPGACLLSWLFVGAPLATRVGWSPGGAADAPPCLLTSRSSSPATGKSWERGVLGKLTVFLENTQKTVCHKTELQNFNQCKLSYFLTKSYD